MTQPLASVGPLPQSPAGLFFDSLYAHFEQARQAVGPVERFYNIGGYCVRLKFAGEALVAGLTQAIEHLAAPPNPDPDLTLCIWDSDSTGVKPPPRPWTDADHLSRSWVRGFNDARYATIFELGLGALNVLDHDRNLGIYWRAKASDVHFSEVAAPLQQLLVAWMGNHQRVMLHAAGVGTAQGGVVLGGQSGSGKSSSALACLDSDLFFLGDDTCLLANDPGPYVYGLSTTGKLKRDQVWRFPKLAGKMSNIDTLEHEKSIVFINDYLPEKLIASFPMRAILLPKITGQPHTSLQPASPMQGLRTLGPSSLFQTATQSEAAFAALGRLVRQVPSYYLNVGTILSEIPQTIQGLLAELAA